MNLTSIKINKETKKKLNLIKYNLDLNSLDEVISKLIDIFEKMEVALELKSMKGGKN